MVSFARGGADTRLSLHFDQRGQPQLPRIPWLGIRADETKRSKNSDYSAVGSVDFSATPRFGGAHRQSLAEIFHELQDAKSPLLDFQARGQDKWRIIHAWLLDAERLSDHWISPAPR